MKTKQKTQITQNEKEAMLSTSTSVHMKCQKRMERPTLGNTVKGSRERRGGSKNIHSWSSEVINDSLWKRPKERPTWLHRAILGFSKSLALHKLIGTQRGSEKTMKPASDSEVGVVLIPKLITDHDVFKKLGACHFWGHLQMCVKEKYQ